MLRSITRGTLDTTVYSGTFTTDTCQPPSLLMSHMSREGREQKSGSNTERLRRDGNRRPPKGIYPIPYFASSRLSFLLYFVFVRACVGGDDGGAYFQGRFLESKESKGKIERQSGKREGKRLDHGWFLVTDRVSNPWFSQESKCSKLGACWGIL